MAPQHSAKLPAQGERSTINAARREAAALAEECPAVALPVDCAPGYTLIREIGAGGMGVVCEARQEDPPLTVALKILRNVGEVSAERLRLFKQEVDALARLKHPNVATIYRTGSTRDGAPFFAMELVRGLPLTEYADQKRLGLRDRLRLFCKVCAAVHYVHRCGRAHRDLKPQNILIDGQGNPKLVDFGLAWIAEVDGSIRVAARGGGTLRYMSPEQRRGDLDEPDMFATDVYSLGVILHELLTGYVPDEDEGVRDGLRSRRLSRFRRELRGDLDLIVEHALEENPAARYPSPGVLADDLERYLADLPISIRRQSARYVLLKLAVRHKVAITITLTVLAVLIGFVVGTSGLYIQLSVARAMEEEGRRRNLERDAGVGDRARLADVRRADALEREGESALNAGLVQEAAGIFGWCVRIREMAGDDEHDPRRIAWTRSLHGACLARLGQYPEAERLLLNSYDVIKAARGEQHETARAIARHLARLYEAWGKPEQQAQWQARANPTSSAPPKAP